MNFNQLIDVLCALAFTVAVSFGGYKVYDFVRCEVMIKSQRGLSSLEAFSHKLTK